MGIRKSKYKKDLDRYDDIKVFLGVMECKSIFARALQL